MNYQLTMDRELESGSKNEIQHHRAVIEAQDDQEALELAQMKIDELANGWPVRHAVLEKDGQVVKVMALM